MTELKVTSAEDYAGVVARAHASEGELVRLPSKAVFRLRRANMAGMVLVGELPQSLTNETLEHLRQQGKPVEAEDGSEDTPLPSDASDRLIFMRETVRGHCDEPRLGYAEGGTLAVLNKAGLPVRTIDPDDFMYAFNWIMGQEGLPDGLSKSGNRKQRRAAASGSRRRKVPSRPVLAGHKG